MTGICIVVLINVLIGYLLFKSRSFSHLAVWNVLESDKQDDFYWPLQNAPEYFRFETDGDINNSGLREEILPLVKNEADEFKIILEAARYVMDIGALGFKLQTLSSKLTLGFV